MEVLGDMIVGLTGLKGSGKDTVAAYLIKQHQFERRAFADPLKKSVAALLKVPFNEIDRWKNDPKMWVTVSKQWETDGLETRYSLRFREFLQRFGTEAHRDVFGESFWLDYTLPTDGYYAGRKIVVTDVRFANEAKRVDRLGGFVVKVYRPAALLKDQHRSELPIPKKSVDYLLKNDGTVDVLYDRVEEMLLKLGSVDSALRSVLK
jgi:hypothetical protein